jgi:hypothetical protein
MTKTTERVVGLVAVIVGLAGYFIGIPSNLAESFGISSATLLVLSLGVLAFGLLLLLWRVWEEARALYERLKSPGSGSDLPRVRPAAWPDLPELHRLLVRFFGEEAPSLRNMRKWHSRNPDIFQIVLRLNAITGERKIVGAFKLAPLKRDAWFYFELGHSMRGDFPEKYIVKPRGTAMCWYIGDVVSTSRRHGELVMAALVDSLSVKLRPDTPVFARALTLKGLGYLRDFNFQPIVMDSKLELGTMCSLHPPDVGELVERLHSGKPLRPNRTTKSRPKAKPVAKFQDPSALELMAAAV